MHPNQKTCKEFSDHQIILKSLEHVDYFACLYGRYEKRMLNYILRISGCSIEEAEDLLQESFIKVWKNLNNYNPDLPFSSWLYRIVHNETISYWRKNKTRTREKMEHSELHKILWKEGYDSTIDFDEDQMFEVHSILNLLKSDYKEVLILKYFENFSYEVISDILTIPEGTVATRLNRARKAFLKKSKGKIQFDH